MKNTLAIVIRDFKRIKNNVIAMIVILGITIVPALYAWFNIAASWDPYSNTGSLKVAVASVDLGYDGELLPISLNLGDKILSSLRENDKMDWIFTSQNKALDGVRSGEYYAAIIVPKDFSKNMMSLFSDHIVNPKIYYYSNAKENAIAPKVTDKGAGAIQSNVNEVFIRTVSEASLSAMQTISGLTSDADAASLSAKLLHNLKRIQVDMDTASGTLDAFVALTNSTQQILSTTTEFLMETKGRSSKMTASLQSTQSGFRSIKNSLSGSTKELEQALISSQNFYEQLNTVTQEALSSMEKNAVDGSQIFMATSQKVSLMSSEFQSIGDTLNGIHPELGAPFVQASQEQSALAEKLAHTGNAIVQTSLDTKATKETITTLILQSKEAVNQAKADFDTSVGKDLNALSASLTEGKNNIQSLLSMTNEGSQGMIAFSGTASSNLGQIQNTLSTSSTLLKSGAKKMGTLVQKMELEQTKGNIKAISSLLEGDKNAIGSFLSAPVTLDTHKLYPIENYGSAMAPFYSTLAMWVGGIVLAAMLKVSVSENTLEGLTNVKDYQLYLGRYFVFLVTGLLQGGLICLGDLFYLQIQCKHPFLFLLTGWFTSLVYVNIMYTLTISFGDIGKAIAVILLVMQVAGSGGTFPIECAPPFFQKVYPLLPFTHSMNAMRECIGGFYGNTYVKEMGYLGIFLLISLFLGLVLRKPLIRLNHAFEEKLESTHLI